jgi:hypothetical protein
MVSTEKKIIIKYDDGLRPDGKSVNGKSETKGDAVSRDIRVTSGVPLGSHFISEIFDYVRVLFCSRQGFSRLSENLVGSEQIFVEVRKKFIVP